MYMKYLIFTDIDDCVSNLCQNGASCNDGIEYYDCICNPGYTGTYCELGKKILNIPIYISKLV